jgi:hypothetical protein
MGKAPIFTPAASRPPCRNDVPSGSAKLSYRISVMVFFPAPHRHDFVNALTIGAEVLLATSLRACRAVSVVR